MVARIFKLGSFLALVVVIGYLYHFNSQEITLVLGPEKTFQTRAAHVIVGLFLAGFLLASFFASIVRIRHHFAMRALIQKTKKEEESQKLVIEGRNFLALGDAKHARQALQKAHQRNPKNSHAGVLLAHAVNLQEGPKQALAVLEKMRVEDNLSPETLLAAADLNRELGNHTAAYDNITLLLKQIPGNAAAIEMAVSAAAALRRFDEAIDLQQQLVQKASGDSYDAAQRQLARLEVRKAICDHKESPEKLKSSLESIIKEHRDFPEALTMLAEIEESAERRDTATKLRRKLFELTGDSIHLETIARCWLAVDRPDTALSQLESAISEHEQQNQCPSARLLLVHLLLHLEMIEQAQSALEKLESQKDAKKTYSLAIAVLKARITSRTQNLATAFGELVDTIDTRIPLASGKDVQNSIEGGTELENWANRLSAEIQSNRHAFGGN